MVSLAVGTARASLSMNAGPQQREESEAEAATFMAAGPGGGDPVGTSVSDGRSGAGAVGAPPGGASSGPLELAVGPDRVPAGPAPAPDTSVMRPHPGLHPA